MLKHLTNAKMDIIFVPMFAQDAPGTGFGERPIKIAYCDIYKAHSIGLLKIQPPSSKRRYKGNSRRKFLRLFFFATTQSYPRRRIADVRVGTVDY